MDRKRKQLPGRELIGFILLLVLLVGGLLSTFWISNQQQALSRNMEEAAWQALNGNWDTAGSITAGTMERWQKRWNLWAALGDHKPMGEIDAGFSRLGAYAAARDSMEYAAVCRELSRKLQMLAESHRLSWWNLL